MIIGISPLHAASFFAPLLLPELQADCLFIIISYSASFLAPSVLCTLDAFCFRYKEPSFRYKESGSYTSITII